MHMPTGTQWLIILLIIVLLFGAKKIPELAKGLGKGIKSFKNEMSDEAKKDEEKLEDKADAKIFENKNQQSSASSDNTSQTKA